MPGPPQRVNREGSLTKTMTMVPDMTDPLVARRIVLQA